MKKITKKWDLETSNAETELKIGIYVKNWAKQVLLKNFDYGQSLRSTVRVNGQRMMCADMAVWRHLGLTWQEESNSRRVWHVSESGLAHGGTWGAWQVLAVCGGAWSACSWGRNFSRRVQACVMQFLAVLGWVLLGIGCSVFLCLFFGSWMHRMLISECCSTVGVTAVARFWQWRLDEGEGSGRSSEMSTETRKSEEWLWYHVNNIKWERKTK